MEKPWLETKVELGLLERLKKDYPQFMLDHGLQEYTTPEYPGFSAKIKCCPEDFVVSEINSAGKVVVLDNYDVPPLPPTSDATPTGATPTPAPAKTQSRAMRKWVGVSSRPDPDDIPPLAQLISADMYKSLEQLSDSYKATLTHDPNVQLDLGLSTDKYARAELHFAVRLTFPVLRTAGYKNEQGESGVLVLADPKYKQLLEALEPEDAERVLAFVNTAKSTPESRLKLSPDHSKSHRTKVHHVLNELYGGFINTKYVRHHQQWLPSKPPPSKAPRLEGETSVSNSVSSSAEGEGGREGGGSEVKEGGGNEVKEGGETELAPSTSTGHIEIGMRMSHQQCKEEKVKQKKIITKFVLKKTNYETLRAMVTLCRLLDCAPSQLQFSGTKDKVAVTTQEMTAAGITAERLLALKYELSPHSIDIGNCQYVTEQLSLGDHVGNRFKITLRSLRPDVRPDSDVRPNSDVRPDSDVRPNSDVRPDSDVRPNSDICPNSDVRPDSDVHPDSDVRPNSDVRPDSDVRPNSDVCPNSPCPSILPCPDEEDLKHSVSATLEAVKGRGFINYFGMQRMGHYLITPRVGLALLRNNVKQAVDIALMETNQITPEGKDHIRHQRFDEALKCIDSHAIRERLMLEKLHQHGDSNYGYVRAIMAIPYTYRSMYTRSMTSLLWNHVASYRIREYGLRPVEGDLVLMERKQDLSRRQAEISDRDWVRVLSSEDVSSQRYKMEDVVLPVIGASIMFPRNKVADKMKEMMAAIGLTLASFSFRAFRMNSSGSYRKLIVCPKNLSWNFLRSLAPPPALRTQIAEGSIVHTSSDNMTTTSPHDEGLPTSPAEGTNLPAPRLDLELNFDLPSGVYATVLTREIMKRLM